jgi:hypothetical protein
MHNAKPTCTHEAGTDTCTRTFDLSANSGAISPNCDVSSGEFGGVQLRRDSSFISPIGVKCFGDADAAVSLQI